MTGETEKDSGMTAQSTALSPAAAGRSREVAMLEALKAAERADKIHSKCTECMEYGQAAEICEKCFPSADDARVMRRNVLAEIKKAERSRPHPPPASEDPIRSDAVNPSDVREIVESLRSTYTAWNNPPSEGLHDGADVLLQAASLITALAGENERLKEALRKIGYAPAGQSGPDLKECIAIARSALPPKGGE